MTVEIDEVLDTLVDVIAMDLILIVVRDVLGLGGKEGAPRLVEHLEAVRAGGALLVLVGPVASPKDGVFFDIDAFAQFVVGKGQLAINVFKVLVCPGGEAHGAVIDRLGGAATAALDNETCSVGIFYGCYREGAGCPCLLPRHECRDRQQCGEDFCL